MPNPTRQLKRSTSSGPFGTTERRETGDGRRRSFESSDVLAVSASPAPRNGPTDASARRRILVVDDNRNVAESVAILLRQSGHDVRTAHDGLEAVPMAATFRPDVVLLDIGLPNIDGYETARQLRQQSGGNDVTLIALTGWVHDDDKRRAGCGVRLPRGEARRPGGPEETPRDRRLQPQRVPSAGNLSVSGGSPCRQNDDCLPRDPVLAHLPALRFERGWTPWCLRLEAEL